jgi:ankyrin repeat protein
MKPIFTFSTFLLLLTSAISLSGQQEKENPIFDLVGNGNPNKLDSLLTKDPKAVNAIQDDGSTPLHLLARLQRYSITSMNSNSVGAGKEIANDDVSDAKILIQHGLNIDAKDNNGVTALHWAIGKDKTPLAKFLIEKGANVNLSIESMKGLEGITPLHLAAGHGNLELVKLILSKGANPSVKSKDGKTPLDLALENNHSEVCAILKPITKFQ